MSAGRQGFTRAHRKSVGWRESMDRRHREELEAPEIIKRALKGPHNDDASMS